MGRTGRFTLIEKWRDVDRPLAPTECPLRVLYKWGEYAAEVRFILCQADSDQQRKPQEKDRSWKKAGDKSLFSHNFSPQHVGLAGGGDASVKSLEYRLDEGVASGSGGGHLEGEHAKLVRLVNMQQERLKTQESQIGMINTEITALEEREKEYEEQLQVIMEELLLQENRQHDLEPQLADLEGVEWENVLDGEKKCERDLSQQIEVYKAKIAEHEQKLEQIQEREKELHAEIRLEEERLASEQQQLQAEERKAAEEATKLREEITKLKAESAELEKKVSHGQTSLSSMDEELKTAEVDLAKKVSELEEMEKELKKENMKDFTANPVPVEAPRPKDSGETILKILEGRLSPRPPTVSSKGPDSPTTPPFITALASKTPSGVWV
nr:hypothetical protein BaRGS_033552 [Batillaria attramentaria]